MMQGTAVLSNLHPVFLSGSFKTHFIALQYKYEMIQ